MKKTLNEIQWIIIFYGLALGLSLLQTMLDTSKLLVIFIISPAPFFISIWLSKTLTKVKTQLKDYLAVDREENSSLCEQVSNLESINESRTAIIDIRDKEITDLKQELVDIIIEHDLIASSNIITSKKDNDTSKAQWACPQCNKPMTRSTKAIVFCDNPSCNRKQWKKDKL